MPVAESCLSRAPHFPFASERCSILSEGLGISALLQEALEFHESQLLTLPRLPRRPGRKALQRLHADGTADCHCHHPDPHAHGYSHHRQPEEEGQRDFGHQLRAGYLQGGASVRVHLPLQRLCLHADGPGRRPQFRRSLGDRRPDSAARPGPRASSPATSSPSTTAPR